MVRNFAVLALSFLLLFNGCLGESEQVLLSTSQPEEIIAASPIDLTNKTDINKQLILGDSVQKSNRESHILPMLEITSNSNTKKIAFEVPSEFVFLPYVKPDLVDVRNFEFGDYMPFVRYSIMSMTAENVPVYEYAFLGQDIEYLDEGNGLYEMLNHKYEKNYPIINSFKGRYSRDSYPKKEILNYFYKSRIVYVSQDGKRIANFSVLAGGKTGYNGEQTWGQQLDILEGEKILYSKKKYSESEYLSERRMVYDVNYTFTLLDLQDFLIVNSGYPRMYSIINYDKNTEFELETEEFLLNAPDNASKLISMDRKEQELHIYSLEEMKLEYVIDIPENLEVNQLINGRDLLVTLNEYKEDNYRGFYSQTYLFNLDTLEMKCLGSYMFNPLLSPDGKYLAYVKAHGAGSHEYMDNINHFDEMEDGFFIKNIETGITTFYPIKGDGYEYDIVNWVNRNGLESLIGISLWAE